MPRRFCSPFSKSGQTAGSILLTLVLLLAVPSAFASPGDLTALSLEELMAVEVFSVSRSKQALFESAAAISVITSEDIQRSGATRLPEVLRFVPGVHVKHIDASKWAITVRGFNNRFVNKLLVLIDGRSVYSPLFAGVLWEVEDLLLDHVDRIEIIRGPGATLWGANAVNGVINIVTKPANETPESFVRGGYGPEERGFGAFAHGGRLGENIFYRIYGKGFRRDALADGDGQPESDAWHMVRGGFRMDETRDNGSWTLSGDLYSGRMSQTMEDGVSFTPPYRPSYDFDTDLSGAHLLGRWNRRFSVESELRLVGYYDWSHRSDVIFGGAWHTVGLDAQHQFRMGRRHTVVWGGEFRLTRDQLDQTERFVFTPSGRTVRVFSGFIQDEFHLFHEHLRLILGSKFEHNDFTGIEILPSFRLLWTDGLRHTFWGSISRSVRLPTRAEVDGRHLDAVTPLSDMPNAPLVVVHLIGNPDMKAEELLAYELGYRTRLVDGLTLDLASFYNRYNHHFSGEPASTVIDAGVSPLRINTFFMAGNKISGRTLGGEINAEWHAHSRWRLRGGYAYLYMDLATDPDSQDPGTLEFVPDNPRRRAVLRSLLDLTKQIDLDASVYYNGRLPGGRHDRYVSLDLRLAWRPHPGLELSAVGQNLLGANQIGLDPELLDTQATYTQRSIFTSFTWRLR